MYYTKLGSVRIGIGEVLVVSSPIPRPSHHAVFDQLQHAKNENCIQSMNTL